MNETIEEVKDFWDRRPCNIRHGAAPVGTPQWSQQVTRRKYMIEPHIFDFAQFSRWKGKRVLEVGCGIGTDTIQFANHGAQVDAVDLSPESLRWARARAVYDTGWPPIRFWNYNAEEKLPMGPFDLAYSFGVIHHTPQPLLVLENMYRALRPGGELRIMLYAKRSLKFWFGEQPEAQSNCPVVRTYTGAEARKLIKSVGFKVESVKKDHIFPWRVSAYLEHRYEKRWPYKLMPPLAFHTLEQLAGHHLLIVGRRPF